MLPLETHFEGMFSVDLGDIVGDLERGADFIGRQESVAAQSLQAIDAESGKPAIFRELRDSRYTSLG